MEIILCCAEALAYLQQEDLLYQREKLRSLTAEQLGACLDYAGRQQRLTARAKGRIRQLKLKWRM